MKKQKKRSKEKQENFWWTVFKVEVADIAFAVDSILAAVALAMTLPKTGLGTIGSLDTGQFAVIFVGGLIGLIIMRFAATAFVQILKRKPGLETAAFLIVGWVGEASSLYISTPCIKCNSTFIPRIHSVEAYILDCISRNRSWWLVLLKRSRSKSRKI